MDGSILIISFASVSLWDQPQGYSQSWWEFHFSVEKTVCATDYFSEWYSANVFLKGGTDTCKRLSNIFSSESGISDELRKISTRTMSQCTISG